ncbi:MAG: FAD:protein FMN transferase [Maritimibacter sp.]
MDRRRFLSIAAGACVAMPALAQTRTWSGHALGAEASVTLTGPSAITDGALREVRSILARMEATFSLYDPASELSRLNARGGLTASPDMETVLAQAHLLHHATEGLFDPTVQPLWQARARAEDERLATAAIGWDRVTLGAKIRLGRGQALTLNGIAQGYATDQVANALKARGFGDVLVNVGEFVGLGGPWQVGMQDPKAGLVAALSLKDRAVATSSPRAMLLGEGGHIFAPRHAAQWSTVSVEAPNAMLADGLSTALCLADETQARRILSGLDSQITARFVDDKGRVLRLS